MIFIHPDRSRCQQWMA